jgi:hypothetical protein
VGCSRWRRTFCASACFCTSGDADLSGLGLMEVVVTLVWRLSLSSHSSAMSCAPFEFSLLTVTTLMGTARTSRGA